MEVVDYVKCWK